MEKTARTDNFLNAIKKYAEEQQNSMRSEIKQLKEKKLKDAEIKGKKDSKTYIKNQLREINNLKTARLAKITQDGQRKLFLERRKMTEDIFKKAEQKLLEFTDAKEYTQKLLDSTKAIAEFFNSAPCVLFVREKDMKNADIILSAYGSNAEIQVDKSIKIGGIKGFCSLVGIVADETLDSKLEQQQEWFIENSNLKVL